MWYFWPRIRINNTDGKWWITLGYVSHDTSLQIQLALCWSVVFLLTFYRWCLHIPQENAITPNQNLLQARKWAFHLLILLCKCDNEHIAQTNETIKREVFFKKFIGTASVSLCGLIKRLMDMFIKTWMVTLFGMTNSLLHIMRSVKHPEKKCVIWQRGSVSTALPQLFKFNEAATLPLHILSE